MWIKKINFRYGPRLAGDKIQIKSIQRREIVQNNKYADHFTGSRNFDLLGS